MSGGTLPMFPAALIESAESDDAQCTPADLCAELGRFGTDPCSNPRSHIIADRSYMLENGQDGLALPWIGSVWCNGPYSNPLPWCERLRDHKGPWCALWKLDTTTRWFAELMTVPSVRWAPFRKRLTFGKASNKGNAANFTNVLLWAGGWVLPRPVAARLWLTGT